MFLSSNPSTHGGVQEHVYYLSNALNKLGHKITIFGAANTKRYRSYRSIGKSINVPMPNGEWADINFWPNGRKPSEIINKGNFDICHIEEPLAPFISWELLKNVNIPKIVTFHVSWDNNSVGNVLNLIFPFFKKQFSSYINGAIYVSEITKKRFIRLCDRRVPQKTILNGLDHALYFPEENNKADGNIKILFLARLISKKGLIYLLKAMEILVKEFPKIKLVIVGDGNERKKFENFVIESGLNQNVKFVGSVSDLVKRRHYQQADIFCAPYVDEGYGLTVLEALACGCSVVGFKNEAFKESLKNYPQPELLVKPRNYFALANVLKKLIKDAELRDKLKNWGLRESRKYNWDETARKTEQFYFQILTKL